MNNFQQTFLSVLVGFTLALFVGYSVSAVYPSSSWRDEEKCYSDSRFGPEKELTEEQQQESESCFDDFQTQRQEQSENQTYILLVVVPLLATAYVYLNKRTKLDSVIANGIGYGLVFVSIYTIIQSSSVSSAEVPGRLLGVVAAALALMSAVLVAHYSFIAPSKSKPTRKK